jgi:hypothetical protein
MKPDAEPSDAERRADFGQLVEVALRFGRDRVHVVEGRAGELELAARLEGDRSVVSLERDERPPFAFPDGLPSEATRQLAQNAHDAVLALVRKGRSVLEIDAELLGLGTDPPSLRRLHGLVERYKEVVVRKRHVGPRLLRHPDPPRQRFHAETRPYRRACSEARAGVPFRPQNGTFPT